MMHHLTNGTATVALLAAAQLPGSYASWDDVLHEGPVPATASLAENAAIRARFLAAQGWDTVETVASRFVARHRFLEEALQGDALVLWFEHDLYDQLQLVQILDALGKKSDIRARCSLINIDQFPNVVPFHGLGDLSPEQMASLFPSRRAITPAQLGLAQRAWAAFCAPTPLPLQELLQEDCAALPFLKKALLRWCATFPSVFNGLSQTEQYILEGVAAGTTDPVGLFRYQSKREAAPFLGDWSFWRYVDRLTQGPDPLLALASPAPFRFPPQYPVDAAFKAQRLHLTETGKAVLAGNADALERNGYAYWRGGVQLQPGQYWRWEAPSRTFAHPA